MEKKRDPVEEALYKLTVEQLLDAIRISSANYGGHYTIMSFTTGYRIGFGTPDLIAGWGKEGGWKEYFACRDLITNVPQFETLKAALVYAIMYEPDFWTNP